MSRPSLRIERIEGPDWWRLVCTWIRQTHRHRHHPPPVGWLWGYAVWRGSKLVAVATVGRPVARAFKGRLELTRVCSIGNGASWGACSLIYRTAAVGGVTLTYTLDSEPGTSLRADGWVPVARVRGRDWAACDRRKGPQQLLAPWEHQPAKVNKIRWEPA